MNQQAGAAFKRGRSQRDPRVSPVNQLAAVSGGIRSIGNHERRDNASVPAIIEMS